MLIAIILSVLIARVQATNYISVDLSTGNFERLPRFWTNTGFCPPVPAEAGKFLLSDDVTQNLILLASLPQQGLRYVRIHWILNAVKVETWSPDDMPIFNFSTLDTLYDLHLELNLRPHIEFMGDPDAIFVSAKSGRLTKAYWQELIVQFLDHFIDRYGLEWMNEWRYESWNEPDSKAYNILEWTELEYLDYLYAIKNAFEIIKRRYLDFEYLIRGPAGLFHNSKVHQLGFSALAECQRQMDEPNGSCPFALFTFHRKGNGHAKQILNGEAELLQSLLSKYSFLSTVLWSNNEADPTSNWSKSRWRLNAVQKYAREITLTVLQHWHAFRSGGMRQMESISHDNAFLSYHPHEFSQRTLFSRFQMNRTSPRYSEFILKPVFSALGLMASLGAEADELRSSKGFNILKTKSGSNEFYAILIQGTKNTTANVQINITGLMPEKRFGYIVEAIKGDNFDPYSIWMGANRPAYPNASLLSKMRYAQVPRIVDEGRLSSGDLLSMTLQGPFVLLLRVCSRFKPSFVQFESVKVRRISDKSVLIYWRLKSRLNYNCIRSFRINFREESSMDWVDISQGFHVPWMVFQFTTNSGSIYGSYRVTWVPICGSRGDSKTFELRNYD